MNLETFYEHFELLADAPNAVARLREMVLDLSIRGKLVKQDGREQSADETLRHYAQSTPKPKKSARTNSDVERDMPFDVPDSWVWANLRDIGETQTGTTPSKSDIENFGGNLPFVKPADILPDQIIYRKELSKEAIEQKGRIARAGSVLMVCIGTIGKCNVILRDCSFNQQINAVTPTNGLDPFLINYFLRSPYFQQEAWKKASSTTIAILNKGKWENIMIPLPPLEEQKRIVAKVDELMALCDDLEQKQQERAEGRARLNAAVLTGLSSAPDEHSFKRAWERVGSAFDMLYSTPETIGELRKTVLQLAVQGKLVRQDPDDEPAEKLLKAISGQREQMLKEKQIKRTKELEAIQTSELPFSLPDGWQWVRLGDVCFQVSDGPHFSPKYVSADEGVPFLSTRNIRESGFELESVKYVSKSDHESFTKRTRPEYGDILYTKGGTTGIALVNTLKTEFSVWVHLAVLKIAKQQIDPFYLAIALNSPHCYALSQKYTHGSSNKDLGLTRMVLITVPLPPIAEQKRIVAKVDELMVLLDELEVGLVRARGDSERLLEAVLQGLLSAEPKQTVEA